MERKSKAGLRAFCASMLGLTFSCRYYHELFLRGRPDLCKVMTRTRVKGNGMKAASSPSTEPNFYAMEPCYESDEPYVPPMEPICEEEDSEPAIHSIPMVSSMDSTASGALVPPAVVSQPSTPQQLAKAVADDWPMNVYIPLPSSTLDGPSFIDDDFFPSPPRNGDEVFFEGHKFRYLDYADVDNELEMLAADIPAQVSSFASV